MNTEVKKSLNKQFIDWLQEQEYAWNPEGRKTGWFIYSVLADKYRVKWKGVDVFWGWDKINMEVNKQFKNWVQEQIRLLDWDLVCIAGKHYIQLIKYEQRTL